MKKPDGWRNGKFSGVLNEMGSHIIDLSNYLFDLSDAFVSYSKVNSVISNVDDIVLCNIEKPDLKLNFNFNWIDKSIRKPFFSFRLKMKDGSEIYFDQQMIEKKKDNKTFSKLYVTSLTENLNYYLRGVDFTLQMDSLINNPRKLCGVSDALTVNKLMNNILNK